MGASPQTIAQLEWAYFPLLRYATSHQPRALYSALKSDPEFFASLIAMVYRGKNEKQRELTDEEANRARNAWSVLQAWNFNIPGQQDDGTIKSDELVQWVTEARSLLAERDRTDIGDQQIGQVLSASPSGSDGAWPAEPVRDLLELIGSRDLETGLHIGKINSRGATSRGVFEGGKAERELANGYRASAQLTAGRWIRTTRVLRGIAESYEYDARRLDTEAEALADRD